MGLIKEIKHHRYRTWKTVCMGLMFTALGLNSGIFGPSMIDLKFQTSSTMPQISRILPVRASGSMIGSMVCGFVLEYINMQVVCIISFASVCFSLVLIPFCFTLYQLYSCMALNGFFCGALGNAVNFFIIHSWGKENGPFMQFCHLMFGFGYAFSSPFIAEPFLKEISESELENLDNLDNLDNNSTTSDGVLIIPLNSSNLKIHNAFYIIGLISALIWFIYFITYLKQKTSKEHQSRETKKVNVNIIDNDKVSIGKSASINQNNVKTNTENNFKFYQKAVLVILAAFFNHFQYGLELSFGSMLPTYARVSKLRFHKKDAAHVTSLYWICFTCFRIVCIPLSTFISPLSILILDLSLIFISNCFLAPLIFLEQTPWLLWSSSAIIGFGISSIYATLWGFLENVMPVSGKMISVVNSCGVMGEFVVPTLMGIYIKEYPSIFVYVTLIYSAFAYIFFAAIALWAYFIKRKKN